MIELSTKDLQLLMADVADGALVPVEIQANGRALTIEDIKICTIKRVTKADNGYTIPKSESKLVIVVGNQQ